MLLIFCDVESSPPSEAVGEVTEVVLVKTPDERLRFKTRALSLELGDMFLLWRDE
jgi:hypothetical protein